MTSDSKTLTVPSGLTFQQYFGSLGAETHRSALFVSGCYSGEVATDTPEMKGHVYFSPDLATAYVAYCERPWDLGAAWSEWYTEQMAFPFLRGWLAGLGYYRLDAELAQLGLVAPDFPVLGVFYSENGYRWRSQAWSYGAAKEIWACLTSRPGLEVEYVFARLGSDPSVLIRSIGRVTSAQTDAPYVHRRLPLGEVRELLGEDTLAVRLTDEAGDPIDFPDFPQKAHLVREVLADVPPSTLEVHSVPNTLASASDRISRTA